LPFTCEHIFRTLTEAKKDESVHLQDYPSLEHDILTENRDIIEKMADIRSIASVAHKIRADEGISLRQPLDALALVGYNELEAEDDFLEILREELNISSIHFEEVGNYKCVEVGDKKICLNTVLSDALREEGQCRELLRALQDGRKKAGLSVGQKAVLHYAEADGATKKLLTERAEDIIGAVSLSSIKESDSLPDDSLKFGKTKISFS
jgi:isoleucyl-tRNA synthetase